MREGADRDRVAPPEREAFLSDDSAEARPGAERRGPGRRRGLSISPAVAVVALAAIAWLLWDMWPDVAYFASSAEPVDLGELSGHRLDRAWSNRFVRVAGATVGDIGGAEGRDGERRRVAGLAGTNLLLDRPDGAGPARSFEGRILPARRSADYAGFAARLRAQGWRGGDGFLVLRQGERPRTRWGKPLLSLALVALAAVNLRVLARVGD